MTSEQVKLALQLRGKVTRAEVADKCGVSVASIARLGREAGLSFSAMPYATNPQLVRRVMSYYVRHGERATQERFPAVTVRSIVERYGAGLKTRQKRWRSDQIVGAAKMAGIVPMHIQARIFNRPNAHVGSIKSLWSKRFKAGGSFIHGLPEYVAREVLLPGYPAVRTDWWSQRRMNGNATGRRLVLWCDMVHFIPRGTPKFMRDAIATMADFQAWLFCPEDPAAAIRKMISGARRRANGVGVAKRGP